MPRLLTRAALAATLLVAGCCSVECERESLPLQGVARTGEELFTVVQYAARNECKRALYDLLSARTRDEHSYLKIALFLGSITLPEPWEYAFVDVLSGGELLGVIPGPPGRELALVAYEEPGRPELLAQVLIVDETDEQGRDVKRIGVEEQLAEGPAINQDPPPTAEESGK